VGLVKCGPQGSWRHHDKAMVPTVPNKMLLTRCSKIGTNYCTQSHQILNDSPDSLYGGLCPLSGAGVAQLVK
jgi:hypothetical protein